MKNTIIAGIFTAAIFFAVSVSCSREEAGVDPIVKDNINHGKSIPFGVRKSFSYNYASSSRASAASQRRVYDTAWGSIETIPSCDGDLSENQTRVHYSGSPSGEREGLFWDDGDKVRIYCPQASVTGSSAKWADYSIDAATINSSGASSSADILPSDASQVLEWGRASEAHSFSAVYPSPDSDSDAAFSGSTFSGYVRNVQSYSVGDAEKTSRTGGTLPALGNALFTYTPSLPVYMAAYSEVAEPSEDPVELAFTPLVNSFEVTVVDGIGSLYVAEKSSIIVREISISSASKIMGHPDERFSVSLGTGLYSTPPAVSPTLPAITDDGQKAVSADFRDYTDPYMADYTGQAMHAKSEDPTPHEADAIKCTLFAFGQDYSDLSLTVKYLIQDENGDITCPMESTMPLADAAGNPVVFPAFSKARINVVLSYTILMETELYVDGGMGRYDITFHVYNWSGDQKNEIKTIQWNDVKSGDTEIFPIQAPFSSCYVDVHSYQDIRYHNEEREIVTDYNHGIEEHELTVWRNNTEYNKVTVKLSKGTVILPST